MKKVLTPVARKLRNHSTDAEKRLWQILHKKVMGSKFRRQVIIGRSIVDFACFEKRIVIEVDGGQHNQSQADLVRDRRLTDQGFRVMRFWNNDVLTNLEGVAEIIREALDAPHLNPPPEGEENR